LFESEEKRNTFIFMILLVENLY